MWRDEHQCTGIVVSTGKRCAYKARYEGQHCKRHARETASLLPVNPAKDADRREQIRSHMQFVEIASRLNRKRGNMGSITISRLRMRQLPEYRIGYLNVYPNYLHDNRKDGLGLKTLSPMNIGPILHGQPGLPPAMTLENLHQGNKVFPHEVGPDGKPTAAFFELQESMYKSTTGMRHKPGTKGVKPAYSVWRVPCENDAYELRTFDYVPSRQFYCYFYAKHVRALPEYAQLLNLVRTGTNVQIVGYDGHPPDGKSVKEMYLDPLLQFGHERVLYALLKADTEGIPDSELPWMVHGDVVSRFERSNTLLN